MDNYTLDGGMNILKSELKKLLLSFDSSEELEGPKNFNYKDEIKKIFDVKKQIEEIIKKDLIIDDNIQDASFFIDLNIVEESRNDKRNFPYEIHIRFSTFGNMVSIFSILEDNIYDKYPIDKIIDILKKNGYLYINSELLNVPYDGINKYIHEESTWWERYFDFLCFKKEYLNK